MKRLTRQTPHISSLSVGPDTIYVVVEHGDLTLGLETPLSERGPDQALDDFARDVARDACAAAVAVSRASPEWSPPQPGFMRLGDLKAGLPDVTLTASEFRDLIANTYRGDQIARELEDAQERIRELEEELGQSSRPSGMGR